MKPLPHRITALYERVAAAAPDAAVSRVTTLAGAYRAMQAGPRFRAGLLGVFAALGLLLAGGGIYGVVSFSVAARGQEMWMRMVLGARPGQISALVLRETMLQALAGLAVGAALSLAAGEAMQASLYGVGVADPVAGGVGAMVAAAVVSGASVKG